MSPNLGKAHRLEEIADGNSFVVPCDTFLAGWQGNVHDSEC